jgi:hypothetical protein
MVKRENQWLSCLTSVVFRTHVEKDPKQPGTAVCAWLELIKRAPGPKICLLNQIIGRFTVLANPERNAPQLTKMREGQSIKVFPSVCSHFVVL